jgi:hypothetical protein
MQEPIFGKLMHDRNAGTAIALAGCLIAAAVAAASGPALAQPDACARDAAAIGRAESQLPRLDVAPPDDKQIICITLETNMLFARRLTAHLAHCPRSPLARKADAWQRTGAQYASHFSHRGCKPTIRGYRG